MAKRRTYTDEQKAEALATYRLHGPSIAEKLHDIPRKTIASWASRTGVQTIRTGRTRAAVEARTVDLKARRQELAALLLEDAHRLRAQLWEPTIVFNFGGKDNDYNEHPVDEPTFIDKKNIMSAAGMALDRVVKLEGIDNDNGANHATSMLDRLAHQLMEVPADDDSDPGTGGDLGTGGSQPEAAALPEKQP